MGLVKSNHYASVECDAEGCQEWRRLSGPTLYPDALAEIIHAGWFVAWTRTGLRTFCQGCLAAFVQETPNAREGIQDAAGAPNAEKPTLSMGDMADGGQATAQEGG